MYKESKPMLTPSELIKHLESKGVKFELINKEDAPLFLNIGNISDIAKILPSDIMKYISIKNY